MPVSTKPGRIAATLTPYSRTSSNSDWLKPMSPNLEAAYAAEPACPARPEIEDTFTMAPVRRATSVGSTSRLRIMGASRLTRRVRSQSSTLLLRTLALTPQPALLTRKSTVPKRSRACLTRAARSSSLDRSARKGEASPPCSAMAA